MIRISNEQRRWRLAHRHRLTPDGRTNDVVQLTDDLVALHSSDPASVYLSALVRMVDPSIDRIDSALYEHRSLVRYHAMRRTLWVMTPEVARLAHGCATHKIARAERKRTVTAMAETTDIADPESWVDDAVDQIVGLLEDQGPMTTRAIGKVLPDLVIPVVFGVRTKNPGSINAHTKVLQGAGFDGTLLRGRPAGNWNSAEYEWMSTQAVLGHVLSGASERESAADLLERWLRRFGPATETDVIWWFGWTAGLARKALADLETSEVTLATGETAIVMADDQEMVADPGPWVRLLPGLDPTAMGWKQRAWYLKPELADRTFDRWGNAGPTVWVDGQIVGGWAQVADGEVRTDVAAQLSVEHQTLLDAAIEELHDAIRPVIVRPRFPAPIQKEIWAAR